MTYRTNAGGSWVITTVDNGGSGNYGGSSRIGKCGRYPRIVIDSKGYVHMAYKCEITYNSDGSRISMEGTRYATNSPTVNALPKMLTKPGVAAGWKVYILDGHYSSTGMGHGIDLAIDFNDDSLHMTWVSRTKTYFYGTNRVRPWACAAGVVLPIHCLPLLTACLS